MSNHFQINSLSFRYARYAHNEAWANERSVEVALGEWFLDQYPGIAGFDHIGSNGVRNSLIGRQPVLEVGAVMPYYGRDTHETIDLADDHPKSRKANAIGYDYTGRNVLSISTLEHMHRTEYANGSDLDGVTCLKQIVSAANRYLITFPTQYNVGLREYLSTHPEVPRLILRRTNWKNEYVKHHDSNDFSIPFGHSDKPIPEGYWNNANGLVCVTNLPELL